VQSLGILGDETFDLKGLEGEIKPQQLATLVIHRANGETKEVVVLLRIDTPIEVDYYKHGGILPFVLRQLLAAESTDAATQAESDAANDIAI
jgi:aconitate hydratase